MRLAIIADIHANNIALSAMSDVLAGVDQVLVLGDLLGYYCQVNEVIDFLRQMNAICVMGNHDWFVLHECPDDANDAVRFGVEFARRTISPANTRWLSALPLSLGTVFDGRSILMVHGSPWRPLEDYLYSDNPKLPQLNQFDFDIICFGQTHRALQRCDERPWALNPGSIGQPRDAKASASALILETTTMSLESVRRNFDPTNVLELCKTHGAGDWIGKHLI